MNPTQQPQQLATQAGNYYNDPQLQEAGQNVQDTQTAAGNSQAADMTLPDLLRSALASKFADNSNPLIANRTTDLNKFLDQSTEAQKSVLPENNNGAVFSPLQQEDLINKRRNAYAAPLSADNLLIGLATGGESNIIKATADAHAANTQQLITKAQVAQQSYQQILDKLSKQADVAMKAADLAQSQQQFEKTYGLSKSQWESSPEYQVPIIAEQIKQDAAKGMTFGDLLKKYNGPYVSPDNVLGIYNKVNYYKKPAQITNQQRLQYRLTPGTTPAQNTMENLLQTLGLSKSVAPGSGNKPSLDSIFGQ